jgi:Tfp pilus assembly protein PilN
MINLIPNTEKKKLNKDFYLRFIALSFLMLGISVSIASILLLPSYVYSVLLNNNINAKLASQEKETAVSSDSDTLLTIRDLKSKLSLMESLENEDVFSNRIINEIILKKMPNIKITGISYTNDSQGENIDLEGIAPSREALLLFERTLEDDSAFSKVNLPISNFIKGSNIKFNLSLVPK